MPRKSAKDEAAPRRRGAKAAVVDVETERNLVMRVLLHSPKDTLAGLVAVAAVSAIVANALFLQTGRHPAPMFGNVINLPAPSSVPLSNPLPRPRPVGADTSPLEPKATEFRVEPKPERGREGAEKPAEATASTPRAGDPMTNLVSSKRRRRRHLRRHRASAGADSRRSRARPRGVSPACSARCPNTAMAI